MSAGGEAAERVLAALFTARERRTPVEGKSHTAILTVNGSGWTLAHDAVRALENAGLMLVEREMLANMRGDLSEALED